MDKIDIENISLGEMQLEIDDDALLTENIPNRSYLMAVRVVQKFFRAVMSTIGDTDKPLLQKRALDTAKYMAIQVMPELANTVEAALGILICEAQATGWHTSDWFGYDSIADLLSNTWEEAEEGSSRKSDYTFIVTQLIPAAKAMQIEPALLLAATTQAKKLRNSVPIARQILQSDLPETAKENSLRWLVGLVADPNISVRQMAKQIEESRGTHTPAPQPLAAKKYLVPGNKTWIVIECQTPVEERFVELALHNKVIIEFTDLAELFERVSKMLKGKQINKGIVIQAIDKATQPL